jgi:hypothetical protein
MSKRERERGKIDGGQVDGEGREGERGGGPEVGWAWTWRAPIHEMGSEISDAQ